MITVKFAAEGTRIPLIVCDERQREHIVLWRPDNNTIRVSIEDATWFTEDVRQAINAFIEQQKEQRTSNE